MKTSWFPFALVALAQCSPVSPAIDASIEASVDAAIESSADAVVDAVVDAPVDAPIERRSCAVPPGATALIRSLSVAGYHCDRVAAALRAPRDVTIARDGALLISEMASGRVVRLEGDRYAVVASGLVAPIGLREDSDGSLVVAEEDAQRLSRVDRTTGARTTIAMGLAQVTYLALGPDRAAYVSAFTEFAPTGALRRVSLVDGAVRDVVVGLNVPEGVSIAADGAITVAEWNTPSRVLAYPSTGGDARMTGEFARGFDHLYGLAAAADGSFIAADIGAGTLSRVTGGSVVRIADGLASPAGIALANDGTIYVVEHGDGSHTADGYLVRLTPAP